MKSTPLLLTVGLICLAGGAGAAEQESAPIEERMTAEEFERAGLDTLSPAQLDYLNAWLNGDRAAETAQAAEQAAAQAREEAAAETAQAVEEAAARAREEAAAQAATDRATGLKADSRERGVIESSIVGDFSGWSGKTLFKLSNGQLWRQVGSGSHRIRKTSNPKVRIEPKSLGSWKLYVEGSGRGVKVTRIQ